jgi:PKD domain
MNIFNAIKRVSIAFMAIVLTVVATAVITNNRATAATRYPFVSGQVTTTSTTPVLNAFYNVPGINDEAEFVEVRTSTGDPKHPAGGAGSTPYQKSLASAVCTNGAMFDVRSYVHNGASALYNNDGSGTAIAHGAKIAMTAPINTTGNRFTFGSTLSASNAESVSDSAVIDCGSKRVKLELVANTVYSRRNLDAWTSRPSSAVNGVMPIGSRVQDSGDLWACWDERVYVVYTVKVVEVPYVAPIFTCDMLTVTPVNGTNRKYKFSTRTTVNENASVKGYRYNYGDGTPVTETTVNEQEHIYAKAGTYKAFVNVVFNVKNEDGSMGERVKTSADCEKTVTVTEEKTPFYTCENLKFVLTGRKAKVTFTVTSGNGATFKEAKIVYSADGKEKTTATVTKTDNGTVTNEYEFAAADKNVRADVTVHFTVGSEVKEVKCSGQAVLGTTTTVTPTSLPKTGMEGIAGLFAGVTAAGAALHRKLTLRRK